MSTQPVGSVGLADIQRARAASGGVVRRTPMLYSTMLSDLAGGEVWLKCENLQRAGSFKIRGAYWRMSRLTPPERARGVVAASAGNHAQGVALAASILNVPATVVMPDTAPLPKLAATRSYGAQVVLHGATIADALARAGQIAEETGAIFIHPFDHPDVVAGQGTVGLEIAEQCPQARTVIVPVGGGGLAAGVAIALRGAPPLAGDPPVVLGVQAGAVAPFPASLAAGHPVAVRPDPTMADGIAVDRPGQLTFGLVSELVQDVLTVTEDGLARALLICLERAKLLVEPAGAAGVAALLEHRDLIRPPVVALLSGGNIDPLLLARVLRHGLAAAGRFLAMRCRIPDLPGSLAGLLTAVADLGGNLIEVAHERVSAGLRVAEVEVILQMETRGPEHREAIIEALAERGYAAAVL
ncbi:MAG: threonine ammonia-lyase [Streptosporangiaceae bacterium]